MSEVLPEKRVVFLGYLVRLALATILVALLSTSFMAISIALVGGEKDFVAAIQLALPISAWTTFLLFASFAFSRRPERRLFRTRGDADLTEDLEGVLIDLGYAVDSERDAARTYTCELRQLLFNYPLVLERNECSATLYGPSPVLDLVENRLKKRHAASEREDEASP